MATRRLVLGWLLALRADHVLLNELGSTLRTGSGQSETGTPAQRGSDGGSSSSSGIKLAGRAHGKGPRAGTGGMGSTQGGRLERARGERTAQGRRLLSPRPAKCFGPRPPKAAMPPPVIIVRAHPPAQNTRCHGNPTYAAALAADHTAARPKHRKPCPRHPPRRCPPRPPRPPLPTACESPPATSPCAAPANNNKQSAVALPLPSPRYASAVARALSVDRELSPLVERRFSVDGATLHMLYRATTARMLRVSVNGAFESLATALRVCEELDVTVLDAEG